MQNLPPCDDALAARLQLMVNSYERLTGKTLLPETPTDIAARCAAIWSAPRAIVAHGTEDDPIFFYANRLALQCFEMDFAEFTKLPSRLSADPMAQAQRVKLLQQVTQQGYIADYSGLRIAKSGRRFMITATTVWNLLDETGRHHGQAAVFETAD